MGLFSLIGGIFGGGAAKKASRGAQEAQTDAFNRAIDEQTRQFDITRQDFAPYLGLGQNAIGPLGDLLGLNGDEAQQEGIVGLENSPLYQSMIRNSEEALLANASATGGLRGGNTQEALFDNRADIFAEQLERQMARLAGASGIGQGAAGSVGAFGANKANQVGNLAVGQGNAVANGILTRGGINAQNFNNAGSFLDGIASSFIGGGGRLF